MKTSQSKKKEPEILITDYPPTKKKNDYVSNSPKMTPATHSISSNLTHRFPIGYLVFYSTIGRIIRN